MVLYYVQTPATRRRRGLHGRIFYDEQGRSSLLSLPEARTVVARVGGRLHSVDFGDLNVEDVSLIVKHLDEIRALVAQLEAPTCECGEKKTCDCALEEEEQETPDLTPEPTDETPEVIESVNDEEPTEDPEIVEEITMAQVENLAEDERVTFPDYNEMRRAIADAEKEGTFDLKAIVGNKTGKEAIKKAYLVLQLQQNSKSESDPE